MSAPKLRFKEFDGDWKSDKVGKFLIEYKQKVPSSTDIEIYSSSRNGLKPQKEYFDNRELQNFGEYGVVPPNYLTYRHMSDDTTFKFNINLIGKNIAVSKEYPVFTTNDFMDSSFLLFKLNESNDFKKFAIEQKKGGTRTRLYFKALCSWETLLPIKEEQTKIASFLSAVDEKISQLTQKHQLLSQYKQGMMQKLFSQQLRFKADDGSEFGEWDQKELKEVAQINPKAKKLPENFIYIDLESVEKGQLLLEKNITLSEAPSRAQRLLAKGDVLFQMVRPYQQNNYYFNLKGQYVASTGYAQIRTELNSKFIYYALHEKSFLDEVMNRCTGTSYPAINSSDLSTIEIGIPCLEEQTKIANFLSAIDQKIEVTSQQIEQAKQWKKGLLQQMFV